MIVTVERVATFELRNLLGWDCSPEVLAAHQDCLTRSSAIWLGRADGVEACAIGVIPITLLSDKGYLWMIHTKLCEAHPVRFILWSRRVMNKVHAHYPTVIGLCHPHNVAGRQWLEWLGAKFNGTYNAHDRFVMSWPIR